MLAHDDYPSVRGESTDAELGQVSRCAKGDDCPSWLATQINATAHHPATGECPRCYVDTLCLHIGEMARECRADDDAAWKRIETFLDLLGPDLDRLADRLETSWLTERMQSRLSKPATIERYLGTIATAMDVISGGRR